MAYNIEDIAWQIVSAKPDYPMTYDIDGETEGEYWAAKAEYSVEYKESIGGRYMGEVEMVQDVEWESLVVVSLVDEDGTQADAETIENLNKQIDKIL